MIKRFASLGSDVDIVEVTHDDVHDSDIVYYTDHVEAMADAMETIEALVIAFENTKDLTAVQRVVLKLARNLMKEI